MQPRDTRLMEIRLLQILRSLLLESGWNDNFDAHSRGQYLATTTSFTLLANFFFLRVETIKNKSLENNSLDELVKEVGDYGRSKTSFLAYAEKLTFVVATVSESIKKDLLESIKHFLDQNLN